LFYRFFYFLTKQFLCYILLNSNYNEPKMDKKTFNVSIVAIIVIGVIMGSYIFSNLSKRPSFSNVSVVREDITEGINVYGKVVSKNIADLSFEDGGRITELTHRVGDIVRKGEILAKSNDTDLRAQHAAAVAELRSAQAILEQDKELVSREKYKLKSLKHTDTANSNDKKAQEEQIDASEDLVLSQEANVQAAVDEIANMKAQLEMTLIRAPFDGEITKQDAEIGESFSSNSPVITIINQNGFEVDAFVSQIDISKISINNHANIKLDPYGTTEVFEGKVTAVDPAETIINGISNYKVTFGFLSPDPKIKSGSDANVQLILNKKNGALVIPRGSIISENGKDYIMVYANGKEEKKEIKTGISGLNNKVEIVSGLSEGDDIINILGK
jgi:HlyD family secretion protein